MKILVEVQYTSLAFEIESVAVPAKGDSINLYEEMSEDQRKEWGWIFKVESVSYSRLEEGTVYHPILRLEK